jgi:hypothetical protein
MTKSDPKWTKGPWVANGDMIKSPTRDVGQCFGFAQEGPEDTANAARIVHCVNCHDELVEALKGLLSHSHLQDIDARDLDQEDDDLERTARSVLSKAKGET